MALRSLQGLLLFLSLCTAAVGLLLFFTGWVLTCLGVLVLFVAGALCWASLAAAVAMTAVAPIRTWSAVEWLGTLLALAEGTLFSTLLLQEGLGKVALAAAAILLGEALIILVMKSRGLPGIIQFALLGLCLVVIPVLRAARVPSALNAAIQARDLLSERLLLAGGALRVDDGSSALLLAFHQDDLRSFQLLLRYGANPNQPVGGEILLCTAAATGPPAIVQMLLAHGADPNLANRHGPTALARALHAGRLENASLLLAHGADPHGDAEQTTLVEAVSEDRQDEVQFLLAHGADPNARGERKRTALLEAARRDHLDLVRLLLAHGADPNLQDAEGATALSLAQPRSAELLLAAHADPNHRDTFGRTAFLGGLAEGDPETLRLLVKHGADVQARDAEGRTVLSNLLKSRKAADYRVGGRDYRLVEWLLGLGVPVDVDAREVAAERGLLHVQALLQGKPCPPAFGEPGREPWKDKDAEWRAALLVREPSLENRYALYRALNTDLTIGPAENRWGSFIDPGWHIPFARGTQGAPLLIVYSNYLSPERKAAGFRLLESAQILDIAAQNHAGLLVRSGLSPDAPAAEIPPADIALIRRCVGAGTGVH